MCQYCEDTHARRNSPIPHAAPRGVAGADAPSHHRERRRPARLARAVADVDQRRRGARGRPALHRLSPLLRRGRAVRRLHGALGGRQPAARPARMGGHRGPRRAPRTGACASSTPTTGAPRTCSPISFATRRPCRSSRSGSRPSTATSTRARDTLMAGSGLRGAARRRTRAALGHALSFATWKSLVREQGLGDAEAVVLARAFADGAGQA